MTSAHNLALIVESDGSEVTALPFGDKFPEGLFIAMSNDRTFQYYAWKDLIAGKPLEPTP